MSRVRFVLAGLLLAVVGLAGLSSCKDHEKKARETIEEAVETCRKADSDGPFYEIEVVDDETDQVLKATCSKEITDFEMIDEFEARAKTGPTVWRAGLDTDKNVWMLMGAGWRKLEDGLGAVDGEDPSEESLRYAEKLLEKAQEKLPDSSFIRTRRLENLIALRKKTRDDDTESPWKIGKRAKRQFDETIAWANENDDNDAAARARYLAAKYTQEYIDYLQLAVDSLGSQDEWLEKSIEASKKKGDMEAAEETRKELEKMLADRPRKRKKLNTRREKAQAHLCASLGKLAPADVSDTTLKQQVVALKDSSNCMKRAKEEADDGEEG